MPQIFIGIRFWSRGKLLHSLLEFGYRDVGDNTSQMMMMSQLQKWLQSKWVDHYAYIFLQSGYTDPDDIRTCSQKEIDAILESIDKPGHRLKIRLLIEDIRTSEKPLAQRNSAGFDGNSDESVSEPDDIGVVRDHERYSLSNSGSDDDRGLSQSEAGSSSDGEKDFRDGAYADNADYKFRAFGDIAAELRGRVLTMTEADQFSMPPQSSPPALPSIDQDTNPDGNGPPEKGPSGRGTRQQQDKANIDQRYHVPVNNANYQPDQGRFRFTTPELEHIGWRNETLETASADHDQDAENTVILTGNAELIMSHQRSKSKRYFVLTARRLRWFKPNSDTPTGEFELNEGHIDLSKQKDGDMITIRSKFASITMQFPDSSTTKAWIDAIRRTCDDIRVLTVSDVNASAGGDNVVAPRASSSTLNESHYRETVAYFQKGKSL
uniref:PH domain-containing protein n=1 Tax=Spongospora subterranea TaxID=70186 RepID=A0A0H5QIU7_9EUKA|eukprot:CRZ01918.1 hypothetical protein [Spongospora subterranea]